VCGKGPEAAALTAVARSTIRSVAMDLRQPSQVIRKLNEALHHQDLDERFCTIVYTRVVPTAHGMRVAVCRGGHTAPLVRRADGRVETVGAIGPLIGVFAEIRVWEETAVLEPGDALVLYTDGVTEARNNGDQLGEERLIATIAACDASSADTIAAAVEAAVLDFCGEPTDDTAVLVLRVND
jgi:serine phosphatase RsbU (regulator of sigma subunit)